MRSASDARPIDIGLRWIVLLKGAWRVAFPRAAQSQKGTSLINFPRLYGAPMTAPADVQPLLRDPEKHWKKGRSAYEAAYSWIRAGERAQGGLPASVRAVISAAPEWANPEVVVGFFEHATALDTQHGPSSNDLMVVCGLATELGVLAVEAKAGESFGELIGDWNKTDGKARRLSWACRLFNVNEDACGHLRWQLFHRTASALIEAKRFRAAHAIMVVHDFGFEPSWTDDYATFAETIGVRGARVGAISEPKVIDGTNLRLAWVRDIPTLE